MTTVIFARMLEIMVLTFVLAKNNKYLLLTDIGWLAAIRTEELGLLGVLFYTGYTLHQDVGVETKCLANHPM